MNYGPTAHLTWEELACRNGAPYPLEWRDDRAVEIGREFEEIRELVGQPININSAYRTLTHNRKSGSKDTSQHVQGRALDLGIPKGITLVEFVEVVDEVAHRTGGLIRGVGIYPTFVHIDTRPTVRFARWRGRRLLADFSLAA